MGTFALEICRGGRFGWRYNLLVALSSIFCLLVAMASAQTFTIEADGPKQMKLIYVKGFNDDGKSWSETGGPFWNSIGFQTTAEPSIFHRTSERQNASMSVRPSFAPSSR